MDHIELVKIAIQLQARLGHSAGGINLEEVPRLLAEAPMEALTEAEAALEAAKAAKVQEVAAKRKQVTAAGREFREGLYNWDTDAAVHAARETLVSLVRVWASACEDSVPGICTPQLKYSTPTGAVNWDLESNPKVWIERSKPGKAGLGLPGDEVVTYFVKTGTLTWTRRAEARHFREMAALMRQIDPEARNLMMKKALEAEKAERQSAFRQAIISVKPMTPGWESLIDCLEQGLALLDKVEENGPWPSPHNCRRSEQISGWRSYFENPEMFNLSEFLQSEGRG